MAFNATVEEYLRQRPAEIDRRAAANAVTSIIAAAVNANPQWFWNGPDGPCSSYGGRNVMPRAA